MISWKLSYFERQLLVHYKKNVLNYQVNAKGSIGHTCNVSLLNSWFYVLYIEEMKEFSVFSSELTLYIKTQTVWFLFFNL